MAYAPFAERATETLEQGAAFAQVIARISGGHPMPLPFPLAFGHTTRRLGLTSAEVLAFWLQALAAQLVSAAVRFVPLGGSEGQAVLARLAGPIAELAEVYAGMPLTSLSSTTLRADLAAMRHETLEVRIFRS